MNKYNNEELFSNNYFGKCGNDYEDEENMMRFGNEEESEEESEAGSESSFGTLDDEDSDEVSED
jgi:hypothetical protein